MSTRKKITFVHQWRLFTFTPEVRNVNVDFYSK